LSVSLIYDGTSDLATAQQRLLNRYMQERIRGRVVAWYYTPMALQFSGHLQTDTTVYTAA